MSHIMTLIQMGVNWCNFLGRIVAGWIDVDPNQLGDEFHYLFSYPFTTKRKYFGHVNCSSVLPRARIFFRWHIKHPLDGPMHAVFLLIK